MAGFDWKKLTNGSFKGVPFHSVIPNKNAQYGVESEEYVVERRLQFIKRPGVDGAPVKDWGQDPQVFTAQIEFFGIKSPADSKKFLDSLDQGTPGSLILPTIPKAVNAYFWKRTRSVTNKEGNTVRVAVTWVSADAVTAPKSGQASGITALIQSIDQGAAAVTGDVQDALTIIQDNPFIAAINSFSNVVGEAQSVVNAVLSIPGSVRNAIYTATNDVTSLLGTVTGAIASIQAIFSPTAQNAVSSSPTTSLGTDSETGQTVIPFNEPEILPAPPPALPAAPIPPPTVSVSTTSLDTKGGVSAFGSEMIAALTAKRDDLQTLSVGRCEDIYRALTKVINDLNTYVDQVVGPPAITYVVESNVSLGEILFFNGIPLSQLKQVITDNPHVTDPFYVPKGTVLTL